MKASMARISRSRPMLASSSDYGGYHTAGVNRVNGVEVCLEEARRVNRVLPPFADKPLKIMKVRFKQSKCLRFLTII
jgi:hypothetical protein